MASFNTSAKAYPVLLDSKEAAGTIYEGSVVIHDSDFDTVIAASDATVAPLGVATNNASSGDRVTIIRAGIAPVRLETSQSATMGQPLVCSGAGGVVKNFSAGNCYTIGFANQTRTASAAGVDMIEVLVKVHRLPT